MVDEIFDRGYQAARSEFHAGLDALFGRIGDALAPVFVTMHRIEWDTPWDSRPGPNAKA